MMSISIPITIAITIVIVITVIIKRGLVYQTASAQGPVEESWQPGLVRRLVSCIATENQKGAAESRQPGLNYGSSAQPVKTSGFSP